jgi:hypothetical protein
MSSSTPETQNTHQEASPASPQPTGPHGHPQVTFTFPIFFVPPQPAPQSSSDNTQASPVSENDGAGNTSQGQGYFSPEAIQHLFAHFLRAMPHIFMSGAGFPPQQYEPVPNGPPKKHATQSALDRLVPVDPATLHDADRRCNICMQDYWVKPVGPRSPYVEDVKDEEDFDQVLSSSGRELTDQMEDVQPSVEVKESEPEKPADAETPLQMSCGHIFGSSCLKEWLYHSPTCPLCRVEVESYIDQPSSQPQPQPFPFMAPPSNTGEQPQGDSQTQIPAPQYAFQFVFTAPPPSPQPQSSPEPSIAPSMPSRPSTAHSVRHHPYARSSTVQSRPDLFCAQRQSGLCEHDHEDDDHLLRLDCGHAFHAECLDSAMVVEGYVSEGDEKRCPRCRRWGRIQ